MHYLKEYLLNILFYILTHTLTHTRVTVQMRIVLCCLLLKFNRPNRQGHMLNGLEIIFILVDEVK